MNRREAIAALVSLPEITRISTAPIKPDDVIVVECEAMMSDETRARIRLMLEQVWPGRKCVVLCDGLRLKVMAGGDR